jgi:hypothetical protein
MDERWPGSPPSPCLDQAILMLPRMAGAVKRLALIIPPWHQVELGTESILQMWVQRKRKL